MKKHILWLAGILLFWTSFAQEPDNEEYIKNFVSNVSVYASGDIEVTETITVYALGIEFKRGLVRRIPQTRQTKDGRRTKTPVTIKGVFHNGLTSEYHTKNEGDDLAIYIGSADVFIENGLHTYEIIYTTSNQIGFYDSYDEIYWNVTGNGWSMPIMQSNCKVFLPRGAKIQQQACYTGVFGAQEYNCKMNDGNDEFVSFGTMRLEPYEGLTVAVGFSKGVVTPPPPPTWWEIWRIRIVATIAFLVMAVYYLYTWNKYGRDPASPVPYPQFAPPPGLSLSELGMIDRENYSSRFLSATVLQWAVNGFVKITESTESFVFNLFKHTSYTIDKIKEPDASFKPHEKRLFDSLFVGSSSFTVDGNYKPELYTAGENFRKSTVALFDNSTLSKGNNYKYVFYASLIFIAAALLMLYFGHGSILLYIVGPLLGGFFILPLVIIIFVKSVWNINARLYHKIVVWLILVPSAVLIPLIIFPGSLEMNEKILLLFMAFGIISLLVYAQLIKKPVEEKLKIQSNIEGFRMYLKMAENERVKLLNPPAETPELFEKYLPYAILFKVEKVWGERFKEMLAKAPGTQSSYSAGWYSGNNFSSFTDGFSKSGFGSSFSGSATAPSNYSSGSGGGGSSGGGGGGGGGGGW